MKKINFLTTLFALLFLCGISNAQMSAYTFSSTAGTYTAITGGTVLTDGTLTMDSWVSSAITIPSFNFNGVAYTTAYVTSNGILNLGGTAPSAYTTTAISSTTGSGISICPFNADLDRGTTTVSTEIRWETIGNEIIFQWQQIKRYGATESFDMQARLNTLNGNLVFVYQLNSGPGTSTSYQPQVGIRTSLTNYKNLLVASGTEDWAAPLAGTANSNTCRFTATAPAKGFASGLTYSWAAPTCYSPTTLVVSNITTSAADFSWVAPASGIPAGYQWEIVVAGTGSAGTIINAGTTTTPTVTASTTGLTPSTSYDLYVKTDCGSGDLSGWAGPVNFTTLCSSVSTFPWTETFGATLPSCWTSTPSADNDQWLFGIPGGGFDPAGYGATSDHTSGSGYVAWIDDSETPIANPDVLTTPVFDLSAMTNPELRFWYWIGTNVNSSSLQIDVYDGTIWHNNVATYTQNGAWQEAIINLNTYKSANTQIRFVGTEYYTTYSYMSDITLDDVSIQEAPTCPAPTVLTATGITDNSASLGWTLGGTEALWNIEWGTTGFAQGSGTTVSGLTANTYNLTGLTANTAYSFYVRSDCGGGDLSTWVGPFNFFTGYCIPSSSSAYTYVDNFTTTGGVTNISNLASGFTVGGYFDGTAQTVESFATGSFDFNAQIVGGTAGFSIWIDWNNDLIFDNVTEKVFNTTSYSDGPFTGTITIPGGTPIGDYQMRITTDYNASNPSSPCANTTDAEFEDYTVTVSATPTCFAPTLLGATNFTTTGADLSWVAPTSGTPSGYEWLVVAQGDGTTGTPVSTGTTVSPVVIATASGLSASSSYDLFVRTDCGLGDLSGWAGPYTFATVCSVFNTPFIEGFESPTAPPICWSMFYANTTPPAGNYMIHSTTQAFAGTNSFRFSSLSTGSPYNQYLITPELGFTQDMLLKFQYRKSNSSTETFSIGTSTTGNDYTTDFTWGADITDASNTAWTEYKAIIPAGTKYIAIQYKSVYMYYLYVDEFELKVPSIDADITAFTFAEQTGPAIINTTNATVDIEVVAGTNVTALVPTITVSPFATINPLSGVAQDYSAPFTYVVTAEDMTTVKSWTVNVTVAPYSLVMWNFPNNPDDAIADGGIVANLAKTIATVGANAATFDVGGVTTNAATAKGWDAGMNTKNWEVEFVTTGYKDITVNSRQKSSGTGPKDFKLQYKISASGTWADVSGATITVANDAFVSGTLSNITLPADANNEASVFVRWIMASNVSVGNGTVAATGTSRMDNVLITGNLPSAENTVLTFDVSTQTSSTVGAGTVNILNCGTDVTALVPTITVSAGATISPASGVAQDFTNPVTYTVTAEDGTTSTWTVTVVPNALPTIALTSPSAVTICQGDTTNIDLAFTGTAPWSWVGDDETGPVTFIANTSPQTSPVYPSTTTTYQIISVTDAIGCTNTSTDAVVVTVNTSPVVNLGIDLNLCDGGSAILDAGNAGSTYLWSDGSTNQTLTVTLTNSYSVTVTNTNSCFALDTIVVTFNTPAVVNISENTGVLNSDATSGNQWFEQTNGIIAGEIGQTYTPTLNGNYYVIVTDVNGCTSMSNVLSFLISVNSNASNSSIIVYPNPANYKVWIDVINKNASQTKIEIRTLDGRLLFENESNSVKNTRISVDLKEFASGIYIVKAISGDNTSIQKLIVK